MSRRPAAAEAASAPLLLLAIGILVDGAAAFAPARAPLPFAPRASVEGPRFGKDRYGGNFCKGEGGLRTWASRHPRETRSNGGGATSLRCEVKISGNDRFLVGVGSVSISMLMINRLATVELAAAQSRVDLLGVAVASVMLLTAFARADIQAREKERVKLAGVDQDEVDVSLAADAQQTLRWGANSLLRASGNARGVAIVHRGKTVLRRGIMGRAQTVELGPIVNKACEQGDQAYLADLQILPGRFEFTYLPANTQSVIIQPFGGGSALIVISDKVRGFTGLDLTMIPSITRLVAQTLDEA